MDVETTESLLRDVTSWGQFTQALRDLHAACGSPTYDALAREGDLAKSAISNLIGRNPLRRPSDALTQRFVSACLRCAGVPSDEVTLIASEWRDTWRRLARAEEVGPVPEPARDDREAAPSAAPAAETGADATSGAAEGSAASPARGTMVQTAEPPIAEAAEHPSGSPHPYLPALLVSVVAVVASVAMVLVVRDTLSSTAPSESPRGEAVLSSLPVPSEGVCVAGDVEIVDARLGRTWRHAFRCPNRAAFVFEWAAWSDEPVARLATRQSWFMCWTRGQTYKGSDIWYYTRGGQHMSKPFLEEWGFVSAALVQAQVHPDPAITEECSFSTGPS